jgi:TolB-like protein/predicted metal-dependent HD superfamily phosphohydrolase
MSSLLPDFEYDIFISYRHNDNRSGWVTEFVKALREELAATIKDPVSVYFDTNQHDGLLETHNVDKSLEGKLKCLVFVPIISQTYCDLKSFAWQHEFCAFNKLSKSDPFGRDIRLGNGNVASRILPVKIHDLDEDDKAILENELSGPLRAVEFMFRSSGVNRPLRAEDERGDNLNRLFYRDQINKVANAIKEVTSSMRFPGRRDKAEETGHKRSEPAPVTLNSKSIAVLPFVNLSQDPSQEYFADGITENILSQLASLKQLRVISRTSVARYKKTVKSAPEIAAELGVKYLLEGSAQMQGNKIRIQVQLIEAEKDENVWSKAFVESMDDIFTIQNNVAEVVSKELLLSLAPRESEKLKVIPTKNLEAYDLFLKGRHAFNQWGLEGYKAATEYFKQTIALDPDFREAYSYLASSYSARMSWNGDLTPAEAKKNIDQYLAEAWKRGPDDNDYLTKGFVEFFINKDFASAENLFLKAVELNANNALALYTYCYLLNMMGRFEDALEWVNKAKLIDPLTVAYFNYQTICLHLLGKNDKALETALEGLRLYPSVLRFYDFLARINIALERWRDAEEAVLAGFRSSTVRPPSMVAFLAIASASLGKEEKSRELVDELVTRSGKNEREVNINIMQVFSALGDFASARNWLNKARETNDVGLIWWQVDPLLKNFRNHKDASDIPLKPDFQSAEKYITARLEAEMPKLPYHNIDHIHDVLNAALAIAKHEGVSDDEIKLVRLAALFHDAGFIESSSNHEERGAKMAREILPAYGLQKEQIEMISKMIMATRLPQTPETKLERILCDADLDYLGRDDYYQISGHLLEEMKINNVVETEREWNIMQKTFLESHRFHTDFSKQNREGSKNIRLQEIAAQLTNRS